MARTEDDTGPSPAGPVPTPDPDHDPVQVHPDAGASDGDGPAVGHVPGAEPGDEPPTDVVADTNGGADPVVADPAVLSDPVAADPDEAANPADPVVAEPDAVADVDGVADLVVADPAVADADGVADPVVANPAVADSDVVAHTDGVADPVVADPASLADPVVADPVVADPADRVVAGPAAEADRTVPVGRVGGGRGVERERDRDQVDFSALTAFLRRRGIIGAAPVKAPAPVLPGPESPVGPPPSDQDAAAAPTEPRVRFLGVPMPRREVARRYALPVTLVALVALIANAYHLEGVDWGDDFALYMRQAEGLALGNVGEVLSANRFAVENSGWSTFSPYAYPWGWPLLITPVYALFGLDYEAVKVLEVGAFCIFLLCFYAIVKRRAGALGATVITLLIGLSPSFVGATDTVLSDIPFLCFVGLTLWWLDRCHERGILQERRRGLVILGLLLAYTVNIRREGICLLVALVALHLAALGARARRPDGTRTLEGVDWRAVATPYLTFVGSWVTFHLLLPTVLRPNAPGTGLSNIPHRFKYHQDILAEHLGLKDIGYPMSLLGSERAAHNALTALLILAVLGVVARLLTRRDEDLALAAYFGAASLVVLVSPYQEGRYLFTITPLLVYFAYQALPTVAKLLAPTNLRWVGGAAIAAAAAVTGLALINASDVKHAIDYRRVYQPVVNGPEAPDAEQMFAAVRTLTRGDDVILFFRARAMTLYTDRLAVQGSNLDQLLPRSDWYVMAKGSTYSQTLLTDVEGEARGLTKAWENDLWVIWRVPSRTA